MTDKERELIDAAEEVAIRWKLVLLNVTKTNNFGLPEALNILVKACDAYNPEEMTKPIIVLRE